MMKLHEFYGAFANVPISARLQILNSDKLGTMCLDDVYKKLNSLEKDIASKRAEQNELLEKVDKHYFSLL